MIVTRKLTGCSTTAREMEAALALLMLHNQGRHYDDEEPPMPESPKTNRQQLDMDIDDTATAAKFLNLMKLIQPMSITVTSQPLSKPVAVNKPVAVTKPTVSVTKPKPRDVTFKIKHNRVFKNRNVNTFNNDLVPIGNGYAKVPSRLLKSIRWTPDTYTSATRKLLTAVFSRSVLATHSLTGKPSPAFPNKPAKKKLNEQYINDIVNTVVMKCNVAPNLVRTSITTKCADESKMQRTRQNKKTKRKNRENTPPPSTSSDSDDQEL